MNPDLLLKNIERFVSLSDEEKEIIISCLHYKKFKRKQNLIQAGETARCQYFILKGCVRSFYTDEEGAEHNIQFAIEDWWIADIGNFLSQKPAKLTLEALEPTEAIYIEYDSQEEMYERIPKLDRYFRILLSNSLVAHQQRILSIISKSGDEKYAEFLEKYPQFVQRIPQIHIASFLGMTPEFLSRMRKKIFSGK
jgi:CRP-like cAMP-binding protein